jgi:hypothetical protein
MAAIYETGPIEESPSGGWCREVKYVTGAGKRKHRVMKCNKDGTFHGKNFKNAKVYDSYAEALKNKPPRKPPTAAQKAHWAQLAEYAKAHPIQNRKKH